MHPSGNPRNHLVFHNLSALDVSLAPLGYEAILGRDVLAKCRFLYHGLEAMFRLAY